jgi:hypothetical protein
VPNYLILDVEKDEYNVTSLPVGDEEEIGMLLERCTSGSLQGHLEMKLNEKPKTFFSRMSKKLQDNYPYSLICVAPVLLLIFIAAISLYGKKSDTDKAKAD